MYATQRSFSDRSSWPGKSEAVWPSGADAEEDEVKDGEACRVLLGKLAD